LPWIERIEVEDGFLDGLDLELSPRLNVVIGARGTGKTSLLELIRFALGAPAFTDQAAAKARSQVRAILGRGRVTVTVRDEDGGTRSISRTIDSDVEPILQATVLAQNEIEAVGASATGRMHLIDRFLTDEIPRRVEGLRRTLSSTAKRVDGANAELLALQERLSAVPALEARLAQLQSEQEAAFERASASEQDRQRIPELQDALQRVSQRQQIMTQTSNAIVAMRQRLEEAKALGPLSSWPDELGEDGLANVRPLLAEAVGHLSDGAALLDAAIDALETMEGTEVAVRTEIEDEARRLRRQLGAVDDEVNTLANQIAELNEQIGALRGLHELAEERRAKVNEARGELAELYEELADLLEARFDQRQAVVDRLNGDLGPAIRVDLTQSGDYSEYETEILERLKGSGLHGKEIVSELAATYEPHELLELIQRDAVGVVAQSTGLAEKRLAAAFNHLRQQSPSGLAAVRIEDTAELLLHDNATYKNSSVLSIGQRCTAVLPLLLQRHGDVLVIDQPEDHLDNSFVTQTLVGSLRQRAFGDQIILASHNANIPVLGEADRVIHMSSDGRRGFVLSAAALEAPESVAAVTDVMEGGAEAFKKRADFYGRHDAE
jgi:ABC-type lipoprotein export system ATPase subunit